MDNKPSDYAIAKAFWEINHKDGWDSSPNALSLKCAVIERAKEIDVTEQPHGASAGSDEFDVGVLGSGTLSIDVYLDGPKRVFSVLIAKDGGVGYAAHIDGTRYSGKLDATAFGEAMRNALAEATPSQPSCVQDARDGCEPYFVEVDQNGCASCGHDRMWTVVGPDGVAASKSWGDEEEAEWFCECMNEAFAVGQANPPAAITAKPWKGETK